MIVVQNLCKRFRTSVTSVVAVDRVSFTVAAGEVYGLLGPNGAGKTTTMRMILGLIPPDQGHAEIDGFRSDTQPNEIKRRVGFVSASAGVYQWLTGREMLTFFANVYGLDAARREQRIEQLCHLLELGSFVERRCSTLSTGQKQRINLARAMVHDPPLMILDEPTLGLDVVGSQTVFNWISSLKGEGKSVILCTHQLEQAQRVCDRFGLLHHAKMVREGTLDQLQQATGRIDLVDMFIDLLNSRNEPIHVNTMQGDRT